MVSAVDIRHAPAAFLLVAMIEGTRLPRSFWKLGFDGDTMGRTVSVRRRRRIPSIHVSPGSEESERSRALFRDTLLGSRVPWYGVERQGTRGTLRMHFQALAERALHGVAALITESQGNGNF
jgi:hypothetical protein